MTPEILSEIGASLFGRHWRAALARELEMSERTIHRYIRGESPIPDDLGIRLRDMIAHRETTLRTVAARLDLLS